ncbi:general stress protein [Terribacillus saccharophilus]|uniref:general stress protein n=1 Tax=Terribacillus saccharophilus TaxID=361277 RepID=UPI003982B171
MKGHIENRLKQLCSGELLAVIGFAIASVLVNHHYPSLKLYSLFSFWTAFLLMEFILLQGTMYWYAKLKRFRDEKTIITPGNVIRKLVKLRKLNLLVIAIPPFAFIFDFVRLQSPLPSGGIWIAACIYLFTILEYINYFHTQLSYDNKADLLYLKQHKALKQASMKRDINRLFHKNVKKNL